MPTTPDTALTDPRDAHDAGIRRYNMAERRDISERISGAAQLLLSLRQWATPEEARAMIAAIQAVAYAHAPMIDAQDARDAEEMRERMLRDYGRSGFYGLRG